MYRQGFGDCFLLRFTSAGAKTQFVMIDCGVVTAASHGKDKIQAVLDDVVAETKGKIDLLIVTHEHWDHVSAFFHFNEYFAGENPPLKVGAVWVAWTEKPGDALAQQVAEKQDRASLALASATERLTGIQGAINLAEAARISGFGAFSKNTDQAMDFVHSLGVNLGKIDYLEPGELRAATGIAGLRVFVLGPPRSDKLLRITNPRAGEGYADFGASAFMDALAPAVLGVDAGGGDDADGAQAEPERQPFPLDPTLRVTVKDAKRLNDAIKLEDANVDGVHGLSAVVDAYTDAESKWRAIDADWLRFADSLALQMNSYTNNTSLVLAFELVESGRVLFFAADAQVGSWMSWWGFEPGQHADGNEVPAGKPLRWRLPAGETSRLDKDGDGYVTIEDLFRETVLYKVGHHGSHNGTLGLYGLDRLGRPDLVAMMTTNQTDAKASGWGDIPDERLLARIRAATGERVLTSDAGFGATIDLSPPPDSTVSPDHPAWKAFKGRTKPGGVHPLLGGPLFYDYSLDTP